jgi:uncharacterized protein YodC (DUF2158 family)
MTQFQVGNVVRLKSGGPQLTVMFVYGTYELGEMYEKVEGMEMYHVCHLHEQIGFTHFTVPGHALKRDQ